jgi:hypothetical protein
MLFKPARLELVLRVDIAAERQEQRSSETRHEEKSRENLLSISGPGASVIIRGSTDVSLKCAPFARMNRKE